MPTKHRGSLLRNSSSRLRNNRFLNTTRPSPSTPCRPKTSFARSIPIVVTFIIGPSSLPRFGWSSLPSWPFKRPFQIVGLGPFHQYRFTFLSLYWAHKWLGFRANFTINSAEKMFATSSLRKHSRYRNAIGEGGAAGTTVGYTTTSPGQPRPGLVNLE